MKYESTVTIASERCPGVRLTIRRMSFGRRLELTRQIKELAGRLEFLQAGKEGDKQEAEAWLLAGEIESVYLKWGLQSIDGLVIDGAPATTDSLIEKGPEALVSEAATLIRKEAGLTEEEVKNSESHSISSTETRPVGNATNAAV